MHTTSQKFGHALWIECLGQSLGRSGFQTTNPSVIEQPVTSWPTTDLNNSVIWTHLGSRFSGCAPRSPLTSGTLKGGIIRKIRKKEKVELKYFLCRKICKRNQQHFIALNGHWQDIQTSPDECGTISVNFIHPFSSVNNPSEHYPVQPILKIYVGDESLHDFAWVATATVVQISHHYDQAK